MNWRLVVAFCVVAIGFIDFLVFIAKDTRGVDAPTSEVSVFFTHPLAMLAGAYILITAVFPAFAYAGEREERAEVVAKCRASGTAIAEGRFSGELGLLRLSGPLLRTEVWPAGLVFKPVAMEPVGVLRQGVLSVRRERGLIWPRLRVRHTSKHVPGDVVIYCRDGSEISRALLALNPPSGEERSGRV